MAAMWFSLGIFTYFLILRIVDAIQKDEARKAGFDCDKCACHCTGYHCHCERSSASVSSPTDIDIS